MTVIATKIHPFVWYELMSTDVPASLAYYERVVGLKSKPAGFGPVPYTLLLAGDVGIGGVFGLTEAMCKDGARPLWVGYIGVDDVDAHSARVQAAGGKIHLGPMDLPGVGRFSMAADPHGARNAGRFGSLLLRRRACRRTRLGETRGRRRARLDLVLLRLLGFLVASHLPFGHRRLPVIKGSFDQM